jgi:hypothetical protein
MTVVQMAVFGILFGKWLIKWFEWGLRLVVLGCIWFVVVGIGGKVLGMVD